MSQTLTIIKPDDFHAHVRQGPMLETIVPYMAKQFGRAIIMPNTIPAVTDMEMLKKYYDEVMSAVPAGVRFEPLMTLYCTEDLNEEIIAAAKTSGIVHGVKLYPKGATTNSESGVGNIESIYPVLELLEKYDLPLLLHGEVVNPHIDIFYREEVFVDTILTDIIQKFAGLRVVLEHVSSEHAARFVEQGPDRLAATVTAHHLQLNRNDILVGGIKPHNYCLPIAKKEEDRLALRQIVTSGSKKFFAGTDSAPHIKSAKESACGCAGIFTHHAAVEMYAEVFDQENALHHLEAFLSKNGADFYELPYNQQKITLEKSPQVLPEAIEVHNNKVMCFRGGEEIAWKIH